MSPKVRKLAGALALAAAVQVGAWIAVPGRTSESGLVRIPPADAGTSVAAPAQVFLEDVHDGPRPGARAPDADAVDNSIPEGRAARRDPRRAVAGLARLDPAASRLAEYEELACALASELGPQSVAELSQLCADERLAANERVASAAILRHVSSAAAPPAALQCLRAAWGARASEPALASRAVRALGAFGDAGDRAALLEASLDAKQPEQAALALAGLSAARGDEAALELASAVQLASDPRRAEMGLAALSAIAASPSGGVSERVRAQCAEAIENSLANPQTSDASRARKLGALAVLQAAGSRPR